MLAKHDPASAGRRGESGQGGLAPYLKLPRASGAPKLLNAVGVHGGASAAVAQVATAGAEGMRTLDPDISGVEGEGVSPVLRHATGRPPGKTETWWSSHHTG